MDASGAVWYTPRGVDVSYPLPNRPAIRYRAGHQGPEGGLSAVLVVALGGVGHGGRSRCALKITIRAEDVPEELALAP